MQILSVSSKEVESDHSDISYEQVMESLSFWGLQRPLPFVDRLCGELDRFHQLKIIPTITEIVQRMGAPRSTVTDNIKSLVKSGRVIRLEDKYLLNANYKHDDATEGFQ